MGNHVCSLNILSIHKSIHKCPIGFSYTCFSIEFHRSIDRMESLKKEKKKKRKKERKKNMPHFIFSKLFQNSCLSPLLFPQFHSVLHTFIAQFVYFCCFETINTNETFRGKSRARICLDIFPLNTLLTV